MEESVTFSQCDIAQLSWHLSWKMIIVWLCLFFLPFRLSERREPKW